jgi:hypothetical protein
MLMDSAPEQLLATLRLAALGDGSWPSFMRAPRVQAVVTAYESGLVHPGS